MFKRKRKIRVALTYMIYPLAMARYFHEALLRREDVELWSAGPFTGNWIPWNGGMNLPERYVRKPDYALPPSPNRISYSTLERAKPWEPDLWLEVNSTLDVIGRPAGPYAIVGADPHVLNYDPARQRADKFFNMQKPYMKPGDEWLPYGYDPIWHSATNMPMASREYDVSLVGLQYGKRIEYFNRINGMGYKTFFGTGPCYEDARDIYHSTKVGFNWSSLQDTTARVFEVMAMGIAPVFNRVPDLMDLFKDGEHFEGFDTMQEAIAKTQLLLNDPVRAEALGNAAREAVNPHSWDARLQTILEKMDVV